MHPASHCLAGRVLLWQSAGYPLADCPSLQGGVTEKNFIGFAVLSTPLFPPLCCRIVLKNTLTAGGASVASLERRVPAAWSCGMEGARSGSNVSRSGALVRLCRTRAQASRPWIHAASRPCGTRADLVATNVAAQAGAEPSATHNAINTVLQQSPREPGSAAPPSAEGTFASFRIFLYSMPPGSPSAAETARSKE